MSARKHSVEAERETARRPTGKFGHGPEAMCTCGHPRGAHVYPSGRQCMAGEQDIAEELGFKHEPDGCSCTGFKKRRP